MKSYVLTGNKIFNKTETYLVTLLFHDKQCRTDKNACVCLYSIKSIDHSYGKHWFAPRVVCSVNVNIVSSTAKQIYAFHIFSCLFGNHSTTSNKSWNEYSLSSTLSRYMDEQLFAYHRKKSFMYKKNFLFTWLVAKYINFIYLRFQFSKSYNITAYCKVKKTTHIWCFNLKKRYAISFFNKKTIGFYNNSCIYKIYMHFCLRSKL